VSNAQITVGYRRPQWLEASERFLDIVGPFLAKKGSLTSDELEQLITDFQRTRAISGEAALTAKQLWIVANEYVAKNRTLGLERHELPRPNANLIEQVWDILTEMSLSR